MDWEECRRLEEQVDEKIHYIKIYEAKLNFLVREIERALDGGDDLRCRILRKALKDVQKIQSP